MNYGSSQKSELILHTGELLPFAIIIHKFTNYLQIYIYTSVVTNLYTLDHFLADFPQTCSIMRADGEFLAIIPF